MRESLAVFSPPGSRTASASQRENERNLSEQLAGDDDSSDVVGLDAEHETCVVRYYTTRLMLRYVESTGEKKAPFLSIYEPAAPSASSSRFSPASSSSSLLGKAPALVVIPPVEPKSQSASPARVTTAVFTVIPAEGFDKEPEQPVCYNDPVELVDQRGRILGIASRSPHAGHLAVDNHGGALVVVFQQKQITQPAYPSKLLKCSDAMSNLPRDHPKYQMHKKLGLQRSSTEAPVAEICGGDRVCIPGLARVRKSPFTNGCVMQHKFFTDAGADTQIESLQCEVVVMSRNTPLPIDVNPLLGGKESVMARSKEHMADRTATGEFVGVLHSGILHRRTDHTRIWKRRFFVLTQVALHRFEANVTFESSQNVKSRGDLLVKDCRRVRYEKFARPHELDIELQSGKILSMHSDDAVSCAKWASVLSYAIESPQWIHAERSFVTFWRSNDRYESPKCPKVESIELELAATPCYGHERQLVFDSPRWSGKIALGELDADDHVTVLLTSGSKFRLSMEDMSRALLSPSSSVLHTVANIDSIADRDSTVTDPLSDDVSRSSTFTGSQRPPLFTVRLRYRAELQLDRRIDIQMELRLLKMRLRFLGVLLSCGLVPVYVVTRHFQDSLQLPTRWTSSRRWQTPCGYQVVILAVSAQLLVLVAVAPLLWHFFAAWYRKRLKGAKLQWFLTLISLEVQPEMLQSKTSDIGDFERSSFADSVSMGTPSDWTRQEDVRRFRLENALETILGRPQFSYFAIKKFFPTRFLDRDDQERRVLLVSLNAVDWTSLARHNVSPFAVERYFFYLWEFIWSYHDFVNGVAHSELVMVLDCTGWVYYSSFSRTVQIVRSVLLKTHEYYPGRLVKVLIAGGSAMVQCYAQVFRAFLPPDLRTRCIIEPMLSEALRASSTYNLGEVVDHAAPADEQAFSAFSLSLLSTYGAVSIPGFSKREVEQATRFTKLGSLQKVEDSPPSQRAAGTTKASAGTKALLIPDAEIEWTKIYQHEGFKVYVCSHVNSPPKDGPPSMISQLRGSMKMQSKDVDAMLLFLHDPSQWKMWNADDEELTILDALSSREDVCFWSRQVSFLSFSSDGNRIVESKMTDSRFSCLVRRVYEERKHPSGISSYTIVWKTTSSQQNIIHESQRQQKEEPADSGVDNHGASRPSPSASQWKRFEDPLVTVCYVLEPRFARSKCSGDSGAAVVEGINFSFWLQAILPANRDPYRTLEVRGIFVVFLRECR